MNLMRIAKLSVLVIAGLLGLVHPALAQTATGQPEEWQHNFQPAATPIMERIHDFHFFLLWIIGATVLLVMVLILWIIVRYNRRANPTPKTFSHNTLLEVIWTAGPIIILFVIGVKSLPLLWYEARTPEADLTVNVTATSWQWNYSYPDQGGFAFDSIMDPEGEPRLLAVYEGGEMVVPAGATVRVIVTASGVIHSWAVPAFGVKIDAVPGRINETWFRVEEPGMYYGQCSELCGQRHAFMPIAVRVVPQEEFDAWVAQQQETYGIAGTTEAAGDQLAAADVE